MEDCIRDAKNRSSKKDSESSNKQLKIEKQRIENITSEISSMEMPLKDLQETISTLNHCINENTTQLKQKKIRENDTLNPFLKDRKFTISSITVSDVIEEGMSPEEKLKHITKMLSNASSDLSDAFRNYRKQMSMYKKKAIAALALDSVSERVSQINSERQEMKIMIQEMQYDMKEMLKEMSSSFSELNARINNLPSTNHMFESSNQLVVSTDSEIQKKLEEADQEKRRLMDEIVRLTEEQKKNQEEIKELTHHKKLLIREVKNLRKKLAK